MLSQLRPSEHYLFLTLTSKERDRGVLQWFGTGMFVGAAASKDLMEYVVTCNFFSQFWKYPADLEIVPINDNKIHTWDRSRPDQMFGYVEKSVIAQVCRWSDID